MKFICPLVVVTDMDRSRNFYVNILKQKVKYDFGENLTFHGDFSIHLKTHFQDLIEHKAIRSGGNNFELYFEMDEIEELFERLKAYNVAFIHKIQEQPWRQKVMRFYDPDHHIIEVGESLEHLASRLHSEGMTHEQIAATTNMPLTFVLDSIKKHQ